MTNKKSWSYYPLWPKNQQHVSLIHFSKSTPLTSTDMARENLHEIFQSCLHPPPLDETLNKSCWPWNKEKESRQRNSSSAFNRLSQKPRSTWSYKDVSLSTYYSPWQRIQTSSLSKDPNQISLNQTTSMIGFRPLCGPAELMRKLKQGKKQLNWQPLHHHSIFTSVPTTEGLTHDPFNPAYLLLHLIQPLTWLECSQNKAPQWTSLRQGLKGNVSIVARPGPAKNTSACEHPPKRWWCSEIVKFCIQTMTIWQLR